MSKAGNEDLSDFEKEVEARFGVIPAFFQSTSEAPDVVQQLWQFAKSAYLESPLPPLFKERLFVYLSRFCEVRYCVVRHCGFLTGKGHTAGDRSTEPATIDAALELLRRPFPSEEELNAVFTDFEALATPMREWPEPGSDAETALFACASVVFIGPARSQRARDALRAALGPRRFEQLAGFLAFVRTAHFWSQLHPELRFEEDVEALLRDHEELAHRLLDDPERGRCEMGERLFDELVSLRRDKDEMDTLKRAEEQRSLLVAELSHRVKNILATVQSIAMHTADGKTSVDSFLGSFNERLQAMAHTHTLLAESRWSGVGLEDVLRAEMAPYMRDAKSVHLEGLNILLRPKAALALAMVFHELATNAAKYGALSCSQGVLTVDWDRPKTNGTPQLRLRWVEEKGPKVEPPTKMGFGRTLIEKGLRHDLDGEARLHFAAGGVQCTMVVPLHEAIASEGSDVSVWDKPP